MPYADENKKRAYQREYNKRADVRASRRAYMLDWTRKNAEKRAAMESQRKLTRRAQILVTNCRKRVRKKSLDFDLDLHIDKLQARIDKGVCEVTGVPFNLGGGRTFDSPSLDRIDPSKGYVYANVRVVLHCVNAAMGDWGEATLRRVMEAWLK